MGNVLTKQFQESKAAGGAQVPSVSASKTPVAGIPTIPGIPVAPGSLDQATDSDGFVTASDETICLDSSSEEVVEVTSEVPSGSSVSAASENGITSLTPILAHLDALAVAGVCEANGKKEACVSDLLGMMEKRYHWDDEVVEVPVTNTRSRIGGLFKPTGGAGASRGLQRPLRFGGMGSEPSKKIKPVKGPMKGPVIRFKAPRTQLVPPRSTPVAGASAALVCTPPVFSTGTIGSAPKFCPDSGRPGPNPFVLLKKLNLSDLDANRVGRIKPKDVPSVPRQRRLISSDGQLGLAKGDTDREEEEVGECKVRATNRKIIREYALAKAGEKRANFEAAKVPNSSIAVYEDDPAYSSAGKKQKLASLVTDGQKPMAISRSFLPGEMEVAIHNPDGEYGSTFEYLTARGWRMKVM